jgi:hypothetical protein
MVKSTITARSGAALWTAFLLFGALLWLASAGAWKNPAYTVALMVAVFSWFGYVVRDRSPKSD